jgi:hypothetical protein
MFYSKIWMFKLDIWVKLQHLNFESFIKFSSNSNVSKKATLLYFFKLTLESFFVKSWIAKTFVNIFFYLIFFCFVLGLFSMFVIYSYSPWCFMSSMSILSLAIIPRIGNLGLFKVGVHKKMSCPKITFETLLWMMITHMKYFFWYFFSSLDTHILLDCDDFLWFGWIKHVLKCHEIWFKNYAPLCSFIEQELT